MDIKELRRKTNLSQSDFYKRLKPVMDRNEVNFPLSALIRAENGDEITDLKMELLTNSIEEVFPESFELVSKEKKRRFKMPRFSLLGIAGFLITVVVVFIIGLYIFNDDREQTKDVIELLNVIAAAAGLFAVAIAVLEYRRKK